jgi:hypothetical protein
MFYQYHTKPEDCFDTTMNTLVGMLGSVYGQLIGKCGYQLYSYLRPVAAETVSAEAILAQAAQAPETRRYPLRARRQRIPN